MKVHFIGIGGIGVSALARYYLAKDWQVSGSDLVTSDITKNLKNDGIKLYLGQAAKNIDPGIDRVIYSAAVRPDNDELKEAVFLKIPTLTYAEAVGELTKQYLTVAVSGSHGKSTTTALLSLILIEAGFDPTVIIGTKLNEFGGSNFRLGRSRYLVIEADEWNNSFHNYFPTIVILTNIDKEHLDTFKTLTGVVDSFVKYLCNIGKQGRVFINAKDKNSLKAAEGCQAEISFYNKKIFKKWPLQIPGKFNQLNAEAAWQAAQFLGVKKKVAREAVRKYQGSWRRMEPMIANRSSWQDCIFINDYAHHPNEIKAVVSAIKEKFPGRKIVAVFQPHQVERLTNLFKDFAGCFTRFNAVGVLPPYEVSGRELKGGKTSLDLVKKLEKKQKVIYLKNFKESFNLIKEFEEKKPVVVFMGAGDIDKEIRKYFKSKLLPE